MTRAPSVGGTPRSHLPVPAHWPYGQTDNTATRYAQGFAAALQQAIGSRSYRTISRDSGVSHGTISAIIRGDTWPDLITVGLLEWAVGRALWPGPGLFEDQLRELRMEHAAHLRSIARRARRG